jgi:hypothetical protein
MRPGAARLPTQGRGRYELAARSRLSGGAGSVVSRQSREQAASAGAALWAEAKPPFDALCPWVDAIEIPSGAEQTVTGVTGVGERVASGSGGYYIECAVKPLSTEPLSYQVHLVLGRSVDLFQFDGTVLEGAADSVLDVKVLALEQADCSARVDTVLPGAVWFRSVSCPHLAHPATPESVCSAAFSAIFENCEQGPP